MSEQRRTWQAGHPYARDHPLVGTTLLSGRSRGVVRGVMWPWLDVEWDDGAWTFSDGRLFEELRATIPSPGVREEDRNAG